MRAGVNPAPTECVVISKACCYITECVVISNSFKISKSPVGEGFIPSWETEGVIPSR